MIHRCRSTNLSRAVTICIAQMDLALQQGRDRLLEMNSCRPALAEALIDESMQRELDFKIFNFMERIYDCYGVNSEIRGQRRLGYHTRGQYAHANAGAAGRWYDGDL